VKVKVFVNGYGTIGKRVARAVSLQDDMEVVGVSKLKADCFAREAASRFPFYGIGDLEKYNEAGIRVHGTLEEGLQKADIVVDATPAGIGAKYKELYDKLGLRAIFQGGEKHEVAGFSFNALVNYGKALGRRFIRVVSCNTTGLARTIYPIMREYGVAEAFAVLVRRAADPRESRKGPINAIVPSLHIPSHHGPDLRTVFDIPITTAAVVVPTTIMHLHVVRLRLSKEARPSDVVELLSETPRVILVSGGDGLRSTAEIMEMARGLGRGYGDLYEIAVWEDSISVHDGWLHYFQAVHQEADVVPENVDAIRAAMELEEDGMASIRKTDSALGVLHGKVFE